MKVKRKFKKAAASVLAASMLGVSCTAYHIPNKEDIIYDDVPTDTDLGIAAIPVRIHLKSEHVQYLNAINKATQEIIASPEKAAVFLKDPEAYLRKKGFTGEVNLDDRMIKFVKALADTDIHNAITAGDMKLFLQLSKEKDLFVKDENSIFASDFYREQLAQLYKNDDFRQAMVRLQSNDLQLDVFEETLIALTRVVAFTRVAIATSVYFIASVRGAPAPNVDMQYLHAIDVFTLRDSQNIHVVVDEEVDRVLDEIVDFSREVFSEQLQTISDTELRNLLKVNYVHNLNNFIQ